eukprot:TRINITY_DN2656_c0_g1_i1.p1 TRINITY_DN2656_c0_g1~~TRINITY_DN2656_c0_g1_i1.p1  ORF type:complete len:1423 (+),score=267.91 TRINITY_DN2656_c0_g1_i1:31-4299(+)
MATSPPLTVASSEPGSLQPYRCRSFSGPIARSDGSSRSSTSAGEAVQVAVRARPFSEQDKRVADSRTEVSAISVVGTTVTVKPGSANGSVVKLEADHVFCGLDSSDGVNTSQEDIFRTLGEPMAFGSLAGVSHSLIAYGESGSGKTYSLMGTQSKPGLLPLMVGKLLKERATQNSSLIPADGGSTGSETRIWFSAIEIFDDQVRDLLATGRLSQQCEEPSFVEHPSLGVQVVGAVEAPLMEDHDLAELLDYATKRRAIGQTCLHAASSSSHQLFSLRVETRSSLGRRASQVGAAYAQPQVSHVRLNLFDLAASERWMSAAELSSRSSRGGRAPRFGLAALHAVVLELSARAGEDFGGRDVHFQSSKLTMAIKDALVGNSRSCLLATVSPYGASEETAATLRFAQAMKSVRTQPRPAQGLRSETLAMLHDDVLRLKGQLSAGSSGPAHLARALYDRSRLIAELRRPSQPQAEERRRLAKDQSKALQLVGLLSNEALENEQVMPYFMNMSDDPALAGCLLYFLQPGVRTSIGSDVDSTIVVEGLGVMLNLCSVVNHDNVRVSLTRSESARWHVLINGKVLHSGVETMVLSHHDRICLGRAMLLRLHIPMQVGVGGMETIDESEEHSGSTRRPSSAELVLSKGLREIIPPLPRLPITSTDAAVPVPQASDGATFESLRPLLEHSESLRDLQYYVKDLFPKLGIEEFLACFEALREACCLMDEANMITREVRPDDHLNFEVEFVWDIYRSPEEIMLIRVMRFSPAGSNQAGAEKGLEMIEELQNGSVQQEPEQELNPDVQPEAPPVSQVIHYWTYSKFRERLDLMRDAYRVHCQGGKGWHGQGDPLLDPWMEPDFACFKRHLVAGIIDERMRATTVDALVSGLQDREEAANSQSRNNSVGRQRRASTASASEAQQRVQKGTCSQGEAAVPAGQLGLRLRTPRGGSSSGAASGSSAPVLSKPGGREGSSSSPGSVQSPTLTSRSIKQSPTLTSRSIKSNLNLSRGGSRSALLGTTTGGCRQQTGDARASRGSNATSSRSAASNEDNSPSKGGRLFAPVSPPTSPRSGSQTAPVPASWETNEIDRLKVLVAELQAQNEEKDLIVEQKVQLIQKMNEQMATIWSVMGGQPGTMPLSSSGSPRLSKEDKAPEFLSTVTAQVLAGESRKGGVSPAESGGAHEDTGSMTVSSSECTGGGDTTRSSARSFRQPQDYLFTGLVEDSSPSLASSYRGTEHEVPEQALQNRRPVGADVMPSAHAPWGRSEGGQQSAPAVGLQASEPAPAQFQPAAPPHTLQNSSSVTLPVRALGHQAPAPAQVSPLSSPIAVQRRLATQESQSQSLPVPGMSPSMQAKAFSPMGAGTAAAIAASARRPSNPVAWMQHPTVASGSLPLQAPLMQQQQQHRHPQVQVLPPAVLPTALSPRLSVRRDLR